MTQLEVACLLLIMFMLIVYFLGKRKETKRKQDALTQQGEKKRINLPEIDFAGEEEAVQERVQPQKVSEEKTQEDEEKAINFTAPDARILVVDDSEINRKAAVGLLAPLQMQIDTADSGKKALAALEQKKYHMVFMAHMMPEMDGIETTKCLREMEGEYYREVPVIALTASAKKDAEILFRFYEAGMNGFVAKPVDLRQICMVIRKYLPEDLIVVSDEVIREKESESTLPVIEGIDAREGIKNSGSEELFLSLLGDFYKLIDLKSVKIEKCMADQLIKDYTIEVHALKSTARMIGAMELSEGFWRLEQLGNAKDIRAMEEETPKVLALYRSYKPILKPYGAMQEMEKQEASPEELIMYLQEISEAIEGFDLDAADEAMARLEECQMPECCQTQMDYLRAYIADVAMEDILNTTKEMILTLKDECEGREHKEG